MAFRNVYITKQAALSVQHEQLVITQDRAYTIPLEDIATVLVENQHTHITSYALAKLTQYNVLVWFCDDKHLPCGVLQPSCQHSRQLSVLTKQIEATQPFKNRMWQQIIRQKITNQARCLELLGQCYHADYLYALAEQVSSGDKDNRESVAARYYFKVLYGTTFTRQQDNSVNGALNYGYAILRGAVARAVAHYGLHPSMGIWHKSELNAFNLVDDFLEPVRPLVDLWVAQNHTVIPEELDTVSKEQLIALLGYDMQIGGAKHTLHQVVDKMIKSYTSALDTKSPYALLVLPTLIPLESHRYE